MKFSESRNDINRHIGDRPGMENWNQDHPERYSNLCGIHIKFLGVRKVGVDLVRSTEKSGSSAPPPWSWKVAESMFKYLETD